MFELRRCPPFELSGGLWPSRGEGWVDPELRDGLWPPRGESWVDLAGVAVRAEGRSPEARAERMSGEARAE